VIDSPEHRALALKTARESIVLLTNKNGFLPLDKSKLKTIAVIGAAATTPEYGNYYSLHKEQHRVNPLEGLQNHLGAGIEIRSAVGCGMLPTKTDEDDIAKAVDAAKGADVAIVCLGTNLKIEAEGHDRKDLNLPGAQEKLLEAVVAANPKTVVVLMNAGPLSTKWARDNTPAMIEAWYAGEEGGNAIADVLLGDYNPGGHLPYTVYESADQVPPVDDYDITHGFTYMYFAGQPVFPFGHGLSYTTFKYGSLKLSANRVTADATLDLSVDVTNTGSRAGDEVVQFYGHQQQCSVKQPIEKLIAFQRVHLDPNQTRAVEQSVPVSRMSIYDEKQHQFVVEPGTFDVMACSSSADIRTRGEYEVTK
jgi:beta-glucosidase